MGKLNDISVAGIDEGFTPDDTLDFTNRVRLGMIIKEVKDGNGVMANSVGNRMLLDSAAHVALKQKAIKNDTTRADAAAQNAESIREMFATMGNENPLANQQAATAVATVSQLDLSDTDDVEVIEGEEALGNNVLTPEECGVF